MGMKRIQIVGGEPLLMKGLDAIVSEANQRGIFITLTTGGTLIEGQIAVLKNVDIVFVSLDGALRSRGRPLPT